MLKQEARTALSRMARRKAWQAATGRVDVVAAGITWLRNERGLRPADIQHDHLRSF